MIHEALLHLWNTPEVISESRNEEWIDGLEDFLHPGEKKILQRIAEIVFRYHEIQCFIKRVAALMNGNRKTPEDNEGNSLRPGLYLKAFCNGVDEVLDGYRKELLKLEDMFLNNPQLSLTFILSSMEKFVILFELLQNMIGSIVNENLHGCLIIGKLHSYMDCEIDCVVKSSKCIITNVNIIFYRHLCNWIIYGDLYDVYEEFFICDANCADEDFLHPSDVSQTSQTEIQKKSRIKKPPKVRKFYIKQEMLPVNIPIDVAETILFMGRIVWIIRNKTEIYNTDDKSSLQHRKDVWEGKDIEYYKTLQSLEKSAFSLSVFERKIEECRIKLTKFLWSIMLDEANLLEHLQLIREYYALGRGELFQHFIIIGEDHLKDAHDHNIITNLNFIFCETARKMYSDTDKTYQRFELGVSSAIKTKSHTNPWINLELNFDVQWPLHIVFHPKAMMLYNKLFCFLLRLKKTCIDLHKLWLHHMEGKRKIDHRVWTLRHNLMFIVNNLQYYLEVDVIEAQFSVLQKAVKDASEFEDIIKLHSNFLTDLLSKTFVLAVDNTLDIHKNKLYQLPSLNFADTNKIYRVILKILELCDEFCMVASMWESDLTQVEVDVLTSLKEKSDILIETLLHMLYSLHEKSSGQHLLQLLYQLDFNRWFSKNKPDFNLSVASRM